MRLKIHRKRLNRNASPENNTNFSMHICKALMLIVGMVIGFYVSNKQTWKQQYIFGCTHDCITVDQLELELYHFMGNTSLFSLDWMDQLDQKQPNLSTDEFNKLSDQHMQSLRVSTPKLIVDLLLSHGHIVSREYMNNFVMLQLNKLEAVNNIVIMKQRAKAMRAEKLTDGSAEHDMTST